MAVSRGRSSLAELLELNRKFITESDPIRPEDYYIVAGERRVIAEALDRYDHKVDVPHVILYRGRIVGRVTLSNVVRGPFQSCNLGYWVSRPDNGRGFATTAVRTIMAVAFGELGLHRIEAGTLVDNVASQRLLEPNGFVRYGLAPEYLNIAGVWQDHVMFRALNPSDPARG